MTGTSIFAGIETVKATRSSSFFTPGRYFTRINKVRVTKSRKKVDFCGIDQIVLWTDPASIAAWKAEGQRVGLAPNAPGTETIHLLTTTNDFFLSDMKAFVVALTGYPESDVTEEVLVMLSSDQQPASGWLAEIECRHIIVKNSQKPFTVHKYVRMVPAAEVKAAMLSQEGGEGLVARLFPNGALDALIAAQAAA